MHKFRQLFQTKIYFGKSIDNVPPGSIVFFPFRSATLFCGLAGIVAIKRAGRTLPEIDLSGIKAAVKDIEQHCFSNCDKKNINFSADYLCGDAAIKMLLQSARGLNRSDAFCSLLENPGATESIGEITNRLKTLIEKELDVLARQMGQLPAETVDTLSRRLENLKDIAWCLSSELLANIEKVKHLTGSAKQTADHSHGRSIIYKNINAVLNSIDRLEVRGRDSAGISLLFIVEETEFEKFLKTIDTEKLKEEYEHRTSKDVLVNRNINIQTRSDDDADKMVTVTFTYKIAAEIGKLGDNVRFLRQQIKEDRILRHFSDCRHEYHTLSSHTRWASVGAITEANCHPVDNKMAGNGLQPCGIIHVCLNGDIDNYLELKAQHENSGSRFHKEISTDTKIIPLQVEKYFLQGYTVKEAFRLAVNDFEGSHAISMHTDLDPGKLYLAQKGSGQSIFIGLAEDHYMPTSEVYGFIEETQQYLKMDGELIIKGKDGDTQGQVFVLSQNSGGGVEGIEAMFYDGTPLLLGNQDVNNTEITSRDIDRQQFPHYFLKEISESPDSVERTMQNRWKIAEGEKNQYDIVLDETVVPQKLIAGLSGSSGRPLIRRVYFVGQGTAGVAARACADILNYYLNDPDVQISALKSSELSGFTLSESDSRNSLEDALVIAISQSGTTTDTNRTVDMVKERGAHTMAIVNRRDSDITFKVDGVMYTSSGRDIEMSVASTKAFYSQIIAGALLGLYIARLKNRRDPDFVTAEIKRLLEIPSHMRKVLASHEQIGVSARRLAPEKTYWATVGSGPNKASADEIRIKLSELCYKTISSDFVEDKKHIDLSSEPLIIVCAAGTRPTVIGDIIKDTAIFKAHKATPVIIADEGDTRFNTYAEDVFFVPNVAEHLAPILNTLVGHIWGYYAALAINEGSRLLFEFQESIQKSIGDLTDKGLDVYEIILEKAFKEKVIRFYREFQKKKVERRIPTIMGLSAVSDLTLLLKYLAGRLPIADFEIDFGIKGTPLNMLNRLFKCLGESINAMARPVDAIKHQAKTVTVGTSRISEKVEGLLFETLESYEFTPSQLTAGNIIVMKNLQEIISEIKGAIRYRIRSLSLLGEPTDETTIEVEQKAGVLKPIPSRVETDTKLMGTKRTIVYQGNVYIGKGRKDDRSIVVLPIISTNPKTPNIIEHLLLLNVGFKEDVGLEEKIRALGGKYEHIKNIVQENSIAWKDELFDLVAMDELFGRSAEKIGEFIVSKVVH
jgi:glucosamine--fructose-6-phosphate aminotransferase (isomerizing)